MSRACSVPLIAAALVLLAPGPGAAERPEARPFSFTARAEPPEVALGQPFQVEIEVKHETRESYGLPPGLSLGEISLRGEPKVVRHETGGTAITTVTFEAAIYDALGEKELPALVLEATTAAGPAQLTVPGPPVKVLATTEGEELADIRPPQEVLFRDWRKIVALPAALLLAGLLAYGIYRLWQHRKAKAAVKPPPPPAEDRALAALRTLRFEGLAAQGRGREHYFRLSEILRGYLQEAGGLLALDMTATELCAAVRRHPLPGVDAEGLERWLGRGDLIRFAKGAASPAAVEEDLAFAEGTVKGLALGLRLAEARRAEQDAATSRKPAPPKEPQPPKESQPPRAQPPGSA